MSLDDLTSEQRSIDPYLHLDPIFVNYRKCFSIFGNQFIKAFEAQKRPGDGWPSTLINDHLMVDLALKYCKEYRVATLGESLSDPQQRSLVCSTETLAGNEDVYEQPRVRNKVVLPYEFDRTVELDLGTKHIVCDTGKLELSKESTITVIGELHDVTPTNVIIHPLIMGAPTFDHAWNKDVQSKGLDLIWFSYDWFETYPQDIDEFSSIQSETLPSADEWMSYMEKTSEAEIKSKFCDILGDPPKKDWGGEQDDHFASVHVTGKPHTAAFLFKGPASFREMTPNLLGKRADQIYRLASTPANILIVQHCHTIGEAVRATLRAFAVSPHTPRRYCLIDGKDTYRLLKAYKRL